MNRKVFIEAVFLMTRDTCGVIVESRVNIRLILRFYKYKY